MSRRISILIILLAVFALFPSGPAGAAVRTKRVCAAGILPFANNGDCFRGSVCTVGVRGAFLDLTNDVDVRSAPPNATVTIDSKGVEQNAFGCVPEGNSIREGWVLVKLTNFTATGVMNLRLKRPNAFGGTDFDDISFDVRDGTHLKESTHTATINEPRILNLTGLNLDTMRVTAPDRILSVTDTTARVEMTFTTLGQVSLETKVQFTGGPPALNVANGWPIVTVRNPPPPPQPNLVARDFAPLFRPDFNNEIDAKFCGGFQINETRQINLPDFQFTVANPTSIAINTPFTVEVSVSGKGVVHTEVLQGLAAGGSRLINVPAWAGRQGAVRLKNRQPDPNSCPTGPCFGIPGAINYGCIVDQLPNTVTRDPGVTIRLDTTSAVNNEASETDNTVVR